jgi:solute:Na+ symporter, SSS family
MTLNWIDWAIVAAYFLLSTVIGLIFTKRGGESLEEYFISGRQVPWWLAGAAMVATTFAADTPLVVTGLVATRGVAGNWLWWNMVMSGMLTVFFFARLWRRANVMTDVEFAEIRYAGQPAAFLRGFRAVYLGVAINLIIMGWVTRAMIKILTISLGISPVLAVAICFVITVAYSAAAGLWAVLWTDLVQFVIKMSAVIVLAIYAVKAVGGMDALRAGVSQHFGSETAAISVLPVRFTGSGIEAYTWMPLLALGVFLSMQWWAAYYPGAEPGGGGYVAQRIFSAKTERDGVLATLLFQVAHYALRPWPWIVTGLATILLYPGGKLPNGTVDVEGAYVQAFVDLLPTPWRGFMMAGFAAAYMSTIGTHLNWGASYLVNDVYKRFYRKGESEKHYVAVSRLTTVLLFVASIGVTAMLSSVEKAWEFLLAIGAGTGLVLILRWYWWRINAWSEISAMISSFVVSLALIFTLKPRFAANDPNGTAWVMILTVLASTVVWVTVTFMTAPEPQEKLESFYARVRPGGPGWARVSERMGLGREPIPGGALAWTNWIAGIIAVYTTLFGIGKLVFGDLGLGFGLLVVAVLAFAWIARSFRSEPPVRTPATGGRPAAVGAD